MDSTASVMPGIFSQWCLERKPFPLYSTGKPVGKDAPRISVLWIVNCLWIQAHMRRGFAYEIWRTGKQSLKQGNVICFRELFKWRIACEITWSLSRLIHDVVIRTDLLSFCCCCCFHWTKWLCFKYMKMCFNNVCALISTILINI